MAHRPIFLAAALAAVTFLPGTGAFAQSYHRHWGDGNGPGMERGNYDQPQQAQAARVLPIRALIGIVQSQRGGEFRNVLGGLQNDGGRPYYIFRWRYPNGEEDNLRVDASSGQVF